MKIKFIILIILLMSIVAFEKASIAALGEDQPQEQERIAVEKSDGEINIIVNSLQPERKEVAPGMQEWGETLKRTEKGLDWTITSLGHMLTVLSIAVAIAGLFVALFAGLGWFKMRSWRKLKEEIEKMARQAEEKLKEIEERYNVFEEREELFKEGGEEWAEEVISQKNEISDMVHQIKEDAELISRIRVGIEEREKEKSLLEAEVQKEDIPITEEPTKEYKNKLDDLSKKIDFLQGVGVPLTLDDYMNQATDYYYEARYIEAIQALEKAIELRTDYPIAWFNKGLSLDRLKRYEEALKAYEMAIELRPDYPEAWNNKGSVLDILERHEEALKACEKSIDLRHDNSKAWNNKGVSLDYLDRNEEALEAFEMAIKLQPDNSNLWNNKGLNLDKLGRHEDALEALEKAIELNPEDADAWNNKGAVLDKLERHDEALKAYEKAKGLGLTI